MLYHTIITILQISIPALIGIVIIILYKHMSDKTEKKTENITYIPVTVRKKKRIAKLINFDETVRRLKAYGALDKHPRLADPGYYLTIHIVIALIVGIGGGFLINPVCGIALAVVAWLIFDNSFKKKAKAEERELMDDALTLCNMLMSQIKGGIYIGSAISACRTLVKNKRLKKALEDFYISTATAEKTLVEAIDELESNFIQRDIITICMIIRQNEETGKSIDVLNDLNKQISDTQEEIYLADKAKLDRRMTIAILILFADIIGYTFYLFASSIFTVI